MLQIQESETNMAKKTDDNQQVKTTKNWIKDALIQLMDIEDFNRITVSQIANSAEVDRRTFYRHYKKKENVLNDYLLSLLKPHFESIVKQTYLTERQLCCIHFTFLEQHLDILRLLKKQGLFGYLLVCYKDYIYLFQNMRGILCDFTDNNRFKIAFKTGAFLNIVSEWIEDDPVKSPEEMTNIIHTYLAAGLDSLFS